MRVVILAAREGWHTAELVRAIETHGHSASVKPYESLVAHVGPKASRVPFALDADAILARMIPSGSLEQIIFRVDALHAIEDAGVRVMNSARAIERSVDKFYTSTLLQQAGLATPETIVCERAEDAMTAFRAMGDVIVKPLFGSMGLGMVRITNEDMAYRVCRTIDVLRGVYYIQRTIDHDGRDIRAFVVGDCVIGAIERRAPTDGPSWRTNFSRGGKAHAITLPDDWCTMALRAARAVDAEYAGVDLLPARDGTVYALEVNGIPGWEGLQRATGIDVASKIVQQLLHPTTA